MHPKHNTKHGVHRLNDFGNNWGGGGGGGGGGARAGVSHMAFPSCVGNTLTTNQVTWTLVQAWLAWLARFVETNPQGSAQVNPI